MKIIIYISVVSVLGLHGVYAFAKEDFGTKLKSRLIPLELNEKGEITSDEIIARPFPQNWLEGDQTIGLIQGHVQPLLFLIKNINRKVVSNPALCLLLPSGIEVVGGDRSCSPALLNGPFIYGNKSYIKWLVPTEDNRYLENQFNYYRGMLVVLRGNLPPGKYQAYSYFYSSELKEYPHPIEIRILAPLPAAPVLKKFHIGMLLCDAPRSNGSALEGFAGLYAATGMNFAIFSLRPDPTELSHYLQAHGIMRLFHMPGQGRVYDAAYGNKDSKIAISDTEGKPNYKGLCPTYIRQRGAHFDKACLQNVIGRWIRADVMDGFVINWEPPGRFHPDNYCWDDRCLKAFSKESGITFKKLKKIGPSGILRQYKIKWRRFQALNEGLIAKVYFDKLRRLEAETKRALMWFPLTSPLRFDPSNPSEKDLDKLLIGNDVEHPSYYHNYVDAFGPFYYAYYDPLLKRRNMRHNLTLQYARQAVTFAKANSLGSREAKPVWFGIEGIQRGSHKSLFWATTPGQMELEIIGALTEGCQGIYIYTGRGMDGHFYTAASRAVQRAALLEKYINLPNIGQANLTVAIKDINPKSIENFALARLFGNQDSYLLILADLDCERSFELSLTINGLTEGQWIITDPVMKQALTTQPLSSSTVATGISVLLRPGELHTYIVTKLK